jgi:hypothetical protein
MTRWAKGGNTIIVIIHPILLESPSSLVELMDKLGMSGPLHQALQIPEPPRCRGEKAYIETVSSVGVHYRNTYIPSARARA